MIVRVTYNVEQEVEISNKFNKDVDIMKPEEYDDYIDDLMFALNEKLPEYAEISCVINDNTGEVLFEG